MIVFGLWGLTAVLTVGGLLAALFDLGALATACIALAVLSAAAVVAVLILRGTKRDGPSVPPRGSPL